MSRVLEADDTGSLTIPADVLVEATPHARYTVEARGHSILIEPDTKSGKSNKLSPEEWERQWRALGEQVTREWKSEMSAVEAVSDGRR